jgi:hypothetical protein
LIGEFSLNLFGLLLTAMFITVALYTGVTIGKHGPNLLPVFFGDIGKFTWPGQFDLDFMCMLALSAIWVAWRHLFSAADLGLAILAFFGGTGFLSAYLLVVSLRAKGRTGEVLLGQARAAVRA